MTDPTETRPDTQASAQTPQTAAQGPTESQAEMLRKYREQQGRMRCVGCGETEEYF